MLLLEFDAFSRAVPKFRLPTVSMRVSIVLDTEDDVAVAVQVLKNKAVDIVYILKALTQSSCVCKFDQRKKIGGLTRSTASSV